jgi:hypothetical protein
MKKKTGYHDSAIRLEGGLFTPDMLETMRVGDAPMQKQSEYKISFALGDEIGIAFQRARGIWRESSELMASREPEVSPRATADCICRILHDSLGYPVIEPLNELVSGYPLTFMISDSLPVLVAPYICGLDAINPRFSPEGGRSRSPFLLLQEFLNSLEKTVPNRWGVVTNGKCVRLLRESHSLTRPEYLEFDIETMLSEENASDFSGFAAFWRIMHHTRAGLEKNSEPIWDRWVSEGL